MAGHYIFGSRGRQGEQGPPVSDGDKGDIVITSGGTVYTIQDGVVTLAKLANMAESTVIGRAAGAGTGVPVALTKAQLLTLLNVADGANVTLTGIEVLTNKRITLSAGAAGAGLAPLKFTSGSPLTAAEAGAVEFDGVSFFVTHNATQGRGYIPAEQRVMLTANGSAITTIANFFGTNKNPVLIPSSRYELELYLLYAKTTSGTHTLTLTNSAAPTWQNFDFEMSPVTGIVAPPGTATPLKGQLLNDATAARTFVTAALTTGVNHYIRLKALIDNDAGTSLLIQSTISAGDIVPLKGSWWKLRRLSLTDTGNFAA